MSDDLASLADEIEHVARRGGTERVRRVWLLSVADRIRIAIDAPDAPSTDPAPEPGEAT